MQCVLDFDAGIPNPKRRKALQACERCRRSKKGCVLSKTSYRCQRCEQDGKPCSFAGDTLISPSSIGQADLPAIINARHALSSPPTTDGTSGPDSTTISGGWTSSISSHDTAAEDSNTLLPPVTLSDFPPRFSLPTGENHDQRRSASQARELRYATMLDILRGKDRDYSGEGLTQHGAVKLINGTNPLSALLRQDLKHKIVTNSCSFRTPDPTPALPRELQRRGTGIHGYDWKQFYQRCGISRERMDYLCAIGCFDLPSPSQCSHLLEVYFSHVHPILPVIDRKEFLAAYYGVGSPPPLLVLHAIFLAASRYDTNDSNVASGEIRPRCDALHTRLRALVEASISTERLSVVQATVIASLHWEGREGVNSAIDNLSLAVRTCQEMGLHRKVVINQPPAATSSAVLRRLWWVVYALDRFNAAQEGTPFLINEIDCDVEPLSEADFEDEDILTRKVTLLNIALATIIEDVVRRLYAPGEDHTTLFTPRGQLLREQLSLRLEHLARNITQDLVPERDLHTPRSDGPAVLWCSILLTHLDAVRILVHRPFLLYVDTTNEPPLYTSRESCRVHAAQIVCRLQELKAENLICFSWPFTVYALVNCLLIFWYDISAPSLNDGDMLAKSKQEYSSVVELLHELSTTWWAAAAKYHLATALAIAAEELRFRGRSKTTASSPLPNILRREADRPEEQGNGQLIEGNTLPALSAEAEEPLSFGENNDFWASLGLDFDTDVAGGVFGIFPDGYSLN